MAHQENHRLTSSLSPSLFSFSNKSLFACRIDCTLGHYEVGVVTDPKGCLGSTSTSQYCHSNEAGVSYYMSGWDGNVYESNKGKKNKVATGSGGWQKNEVVKIQLNFNDHQMSIWKGGSLLGKFSIKKGNKYFPALTCGGSGANAQDFRLSF